MPVASIFFGFLVLLFAGFVGCQLLGHHFAKRQRDKGAVPAKGTTAVQGSLFALLGLLIAFTISGAETRLQNRRQLIVDEANAIGTAYLRLDLLPEHAQPLLRDDFRRYVDARLAFYADVLDLDRARAEHRRAAEMQDELWAHVVAAVGKTPDTRPALLLLPAVNEMFDVTTARDAALWTHVPIAIFVLLLALAFACAFFAGTQMGRSDRPSMPHVIAFAATLALTCYVIVNVEFPRIGFVQLGPIDALLGQVRQQMR
jgi:hypothetical protein